MERRTKIAPFPPISLRTTIDVNRNFVVVLFVHWPSAFCMPGNPTCQIHRDFFIPDKGAPVRLENKSKEHILAMWEQQQILVRFQNKTHVVSIPDKLAGDRGAATSGAAPFLLSFLSDRTGWPMASLRVTSWQLPFCEVCVIPSILGGKGGFGTLLKGQSRQAGAKLTTDFGACRDLQGRRLRHVNDEIKLRKWRDMERRRQAGEKVAEDELWKTPSGIYNWHLMTPTWADISKKATYRIQRQFKKLDEKEKKKVLLKQEQEDVYRKSMTHYLEQATSAVESFQQTIPDAIRQGLAASKKRKRPSIERQHDQQPNSLCTLSGEAVVATKERSVEIQSKSGFCTAVLVLDRFTPPDDTPILYYEVTLVSGGLAQIGWACLVGEEVFSPSNDLGDGVGDDSASFAIDGSRRLKFHAGNEETYGSSWKGGDRLGCMFHTKEGVISFTLNGKELKKAFETTKSLVPAFSCNQGEILELHTTKDDCLHFPKGAIAVGDLVVETPSTVAGQPAKLQMLGAGKSDKKADTKSELRDDATKFQFNNKAGAEQKPKEPINQEPLDLEQFKSAEELEGLGLDRLKGALMAIQAKCG